jgi:multiple sugar transport system substrate-binding protein
VTLRWSMWSATQAEKDQWQGLADDVTKIYPNIKVTFETIAFNDYWPKLETQLASSTEPDIIAMQSLRMPVFASRNALRPLKPLFAKTPEFKFDDFATTIEQGMSFKGEVYALAYDRGPILLYYNKDLFAAAGVPAPSPTTPMTFDQFRDLATKLTKGDQYGFVMQPNFDSAISWLWSGGGDYMNADETTCTLDSPESMAALEFISGLWLKDKIAAPITDIANAQFGNETFYAGKTAMTINGPWQVVNVRKSAKFDFDYVPFPAGKAGSVPWDAGSGFGISNKTKNPDEAWQALTALTSTESLKKIANGGRAFPARKSAVSAYIDPALPPKNATIVEAIDEKARFLKTTTTWQEIEVMMGQDFASQLFLGQKSVKDIVATVKPKFDALLKKHQDLLKK